MSNNQNPEVMDKVQKKAEEAANKMRDSCDGSYVGSEENIDIDIDGENVDLFVVAFWEKSFWFEFSATVNGVKYTD